jgi:hypothetical protein
MTSPSNSQRSFSSVDAKTLGSSQPGDFRASFESMYQREFGFFLPEKTIRVDDVRVRAVAQSGLNVLSTVTSASGFDANYNFGVHFSQTSFNPATMFKRVSRPSLRLASKPRLLCTNSSRCTLGTRCAAQRCFWMSTTPLLSTTTVLPASQGMAT